MYYLKKDNDPDNINSPVVKDFGDMNSADPKSLTEFLVTAMKNFPAENYALVISDHGDGWKGAIVDETSFGWMKLPQMREAIENAEKITGKQLAILAFDACLMAAGEVAYELKDTAKYLVASQEAEGAEGFPYVPLLTNKGLNRLEQTLNKRLDISPKELAKKMVTTAESNRKALPTLSAIDLTKMDNYGKATDEFAQAIIDTDTDPNIFRKIAANTQGVDKPSYRDHYHFAKLISESDDITDQKLKDTAKALMEIINEAVIKEQHDDEYYSNCHGLNVEIPTDGEGVLKRYKEIRFAKETKWDEAMKKIPRYLQPDNPYGPDFNDFAISGAM
jgi:tetratricopeptide (TPR) repeat protein